MLRNVFSVSLLLGSLAACQSAPKKLVNCQAVVKEYADRLGDNMDMAVPIPIPDGGIIIQLGDNPSNVSGLMITSPHFFKFGIPKIPGIKLELRPEQCERSGLAYEVRDFKATGEVQGGAVSPEF